MTPTEVARKLYEESVTQLFEGSNTYRTLRDAAEQDTPGVMGKITDWAWNSALIEHALENGQATTVQEFTNLAKLTARAAIKKMYEAHAAQLEQQGNV